MRTRGAENRVKNSIKFNQQEKKTSSCRDAACGYGATQVAPVTNVRVWMKWKSGRFRAKAPSPGSHRRARLS